MRTEFKLTGVDDAIAKLQALPAELGAKGGGPALAALRAGARVIFFEAMSNLARNTSQDQYTTGLLASAMAIKRGRAIKGSKGEKVLITVRKKPYPNRTPDGAAHTRQTAQLMEYGSSKQAAEPFLLPAFNAKRGEAVTTIINELNRAIQRAAKKMAGLKKAK